VVCFHDDTHMMFTRGDSVGKADTRLGSNAKINMSYGVSNGDHGAMCKIRSDCRARGQDFVQGAERRFREVGRSGSRSRQTGACTVYPASQATSGELTEYEDPNSGSQSYHLSHAAATDGTQS
jgi:hypothetical protein